ncbi:hypothetical protein BKA81DRAFT_355611 [Phyllosticta paracitricarpa]
MMEYSTTAAALGRPPVNASLSWPSPPLSYDRQSRRLGFLVFAKLKILRLQDQVLRRPKGPPSRAGLRAPLSLPCGKADDRRRR